MNTASCTIVSLTVVSVFCRLDAAALVVGNVWIAILGKRSVRHGQLTEHFNGLPFNGAVAGGMYGHHVSVEVMNTFCISNKRGPTVSITWPLYSGPRGLHSPIKSISPPCGHPPEGFLGMDQKAGQILVGEESESEKRRTNDGRGRRM